MRTRLRPRRKRNGAAKFKLLTTVFDGARRTARVSECVCARVSYVTKSRNWRPLLPRGRAGYRINRRCQIARLHAQVRTRAHTCLSPCEATPLSHSRAYALNPTRREAPTP
eukprot:4913970-Pleurochrysis_carterae.AAC.1